MIVIRQLIDLHSQDMPAFEYLETQLIRLDFLKTSVTLVVTLSNAIKIIGKTRISHKVYRVSEFIGHHFCKQGAGCIQAHLNVSRG